MSGFSIEEAQEILKKEYVVDNFLAIIDELLPDFREDYHEVEYNGNIFQYVRQLGGSKSCNLTVYEVMLGNGTLNSRVAITQEMFSVLKHHLVSNALISFISEDSRNYRISLLTSKFVETEGDKHKKVLSDPRRYSYSLGYGTKTKTAYDFLISKGKVSSLDELRERFSVEVVNKMFYREIAKLFTRLVGGETYDKQKFDKILRVKGVDDKNKDVEFAVRLIGRIVFCWFLKEKKSANGVPLIPEGIFTKGYISSHKKYYHNVLEPLFYEVLNTPINERKGWITSCNTFDTIPYLNGGLFSPHQDDHYVPVINGTNATDGDVYIPDEWFVDFFDLLNQYNFTVDENTSYDVELSIDPEMLGRIFENLLAEINPETGESARNNTGSFYTPRNIVDFMVDNSLTRYLEKETGIKLKKLEALISYNKEEMDFELSSNEKNLIINALYSVTVLDPACGSGAFPMGMLQKMVYVLQTIDPDAKLWFDLTTGNASESEKSDMVKYYNVGALDYIRKLTVIQNSIFGVDIQPIAVEIARLRCFLAIIIDEEITDDEPNRGVKPLPNLEFKFVIANTLLSVSSGKNKQHQINFFINDNHFDEFDKIRKKFFYASDVGDKRRIQAEFEKLRDSMSATNNIDLGREKKSQDMNAYTYQKLKGRNRNADSDEDRDKVINGYNQLCNWNPFLNYSSDWFDPSWMFGVDNGFDIVIGNPPYIQLQKDEGKLANLYEGCGYKSFNRMGDIYCLFYERGCQLLKEGGILTYITSNKWLRAGYGENLRSVLSRYNPVLLVDFADKKVFEAASVDVNVLLMKKEENMHSTHSCVVREKSANDLSVYVKQNGCKCSFDTGNGWLIMTPIELGIREKIEKLGTPLKDWDIRMNRGVLTGYNKAFIITRVQKDELIKEDPHSAEIIRPILRGRDIKRYGYSDSDLFLIYVPWHFPLTYDKSIIGASKKAEILFKETYPAIYNHLLRYKEPLSKRNVAETGIRYEWYALQRYGAQYSDDFSKQKIIWGEISDKPKFAIDLEGEYVVEATVFLMVGSHLKYLLCFLNSKLSAYYFSKYGTTIGEALRWKKYMVEKLPIPKVNAENEDAIIRLLDSLLSSTSDVDAEKYLSLIDDKIYEILGFTDEEISFIEAVSHDNKTT